MTQTKPRVGVDVDGVLADLLTPLFQHLNAMLGTTYAPDHMKAWGVTELIPEDRRNEFWQTFGRDVRVHDALQPCPGAIEGMQVLAEVADIYIVTTYLRSAPSWVHDRDKWLSDRFGISDKKIVHTHAKYTFFGKALVDDKPSTIEAWSREHPRGTGVLWDQPYNRATPTRLTLWSTPGMWYGEIGDGHALISTRTSDWGSLCQLLRKE